MTARVRACLTIRLRSLLVVLVLASSFAIVPAIPQSASAVTPVLYASTGAGGGQSGCGGTLSSLYTLDAATGAATKVADITIGGTQVRHVTALAVHPVTGVLYGFMNGQQDDCSDFAEGTLLTIDTATGAATIVGSQGDANIQVPDMSFDPLGTLYAWAKCDFFCDPIRDDLMVLDTADGTSTKVGECGCDVDQPGLAFDPTRKLYLKAGSTLQRLDRTTGTPVGAPLSLTAGTYHNMLAFGPGPTLYTGTRSNTGFTLRTINTSTGTVTTVGSNNVVNIGALAWDLGTPSGTADLSIAKVVDEDAPDPETPVTFTITVSNAGPDTATGVVVKDVLPSGFTYVSDDGGGDYTSGTGIWDVGSIAFPGSAALEITATFHASGSHTNIAEVIEDETFDPDSVPGSGEGDTFTSLSVIPTLYASTGAGGGQSGCGGTLSSLYTLDAATGAATKVADITIGGTQVRHVTALAVHPVTGVLYGFMNGQQDDCSDFAEGTLLTIDTATGAATIVGSQGDANIQVPDMSFDPLGTLYAWAKCDFFCDPIRDDLMVLDTADGTSTKVGECGCDVDQPGLAFDPTRKLYLKAGSTLQRLDRTTGTPVGAPLSLTAGTYHNMLAFGPGPTLYTGTRSNTGFTLRTINTSTGTVTTVGSNNVVNIGALAWDLGTPSGTADLSIAKVVDEDAPDPETPVTFTITVSNAGPDTATGVVVKDVLPSGFTYVSDDGGGDYTSGTGIWDVGSIAFPGSAALEITATFHASGSHTNIAEVIEDETFDPDSVPGSGEGDTYSTVTFTPTLYAATGAGGSQGNCGGTLSSLYALDAATGAATRIAEITIGGTRVRHVTGLAVDPTTGTLYGFMNGQSTVDSCPDFATGTLLTIDKTTGAATIVGSQGAPALEVPDMAFDPFGNLYAFGICDGGPNGPCRRDLFTLDKTNGTSTRVGECFCDGSSYGLAVDSTGKMYLKPGTSLDRLNQFTGADFESTPLSPSGTYHNMLAFGPGDVLYTGTRSNTGLTLKTINRSNGNVTTVGSNTVTNISALAWDLGTYTPPPIADLAIDISVDDATPSDFFTDVTFTITVSNGGPDTATGVVAYHPPTPLATYVSDDSSGDAYDPDTGIWTIGSLASGGSATLHVVRRVQPPFQNYSISAEVLEAPDTYDPDSVAGSGEGDIRDSQNISVQADATIDAHADVIVKGGTLASEDEQKFSVVVINAGEAPLPLSPGDIEVTVKDNEDNASVVTCKPFSATTVKSGSSKKMSCTADIAGLGLAPGDPVTYQATVDIPSDGFTANDTDTVFRTLAADKDTPPTTTDAHADVILKGGTLASEDSQKFSVVVINAGDVPLQLSPGNLQVFVNSSTVSCNEFKPATVKSGSSKKVKCAVNIAVLNLAPGESVTYRATVGVPSDSHTANDTDSVFRTLASET